MAGEKKHVNFSVESFEQASIFQPWTRKLAIKNKESGFDYRVVKDSPESIEFREAQGWEPRVVKKGLNGAPDEYERPVGGMIVMQRPTEIGDMHREALRRRAYKKMKGPVRDVQRTARSLGVDTMDMSKYYRAPLDVGINEPKDKPIGKELKERS